MSLPLHFFLELETRQGSMFQTVHLYIWAVANYNTRTFKLNNSCEFQNVIRGNTLTPDPLHPHPAASFWRNASENRYVTHPLTFILKRFCLFLLFLPPSKILFCLMVCSFHSLILLFTDFLVFRMYLNVYYSTVFILSIFSLFLCRFNCKIFYLYWWWICNKFENFTYN